MLFAQVHKTRQVGNGNTFKLGSATTHAFYSPKTETILLHLRIRSLMTSELEQQEKR